MKRLLVLSLALATYCVASDPGPPTGHGIDRTYDDGYVLVDITGNSFGLTWNWGYVEASQYFAATDTYHFHTIQITGNMATVLTDVYPAGGVYAPAPHAGSFAGPGPAISDEPISRSIQTFVVPVVYASRTGTNLVLRSIGSTNVVLAASTDLSNRPLVASWITLTNAPVVLSNQAVFTLPSDTTRRFYRAKLVLP